MYVLIKRMEGSKMTTLFICDKDNKDKANILHGHVNYNNNIPEISYYYSYLEVY